MASPLAQALALQGSVRGSPVTVSPTDVIGAYKLSSDVAEKNYQAKLAAQNAMWGGLASLGAAGAIGFGPSLMKKYFASGVGNAASPAAGATTTSGIDAATGAPAAASSTPIWNAPGAAAATGSSDAVAPSMFDIGASAAPADFSIGDIAPSVAPSIAADYGLTDAGTGAASLLGGDAAGAAGSIAADMAPALAAGAAGTDAAAIGIPDFLASILAFL
jgi:hypothetical protein